MQSRAQHSRNLIRIASRYQDNALTLHALFLIVPPGLIQAVPTAIKTKMQQEQFYKEASTPAKASSSQCNSTEMPPDLPLCCGTGCAVCVLDYPELFSSSQSGDGQADRQMLAMLDAIEQAQLQAGQIIGDSGGELQ